jgi:uncharacterized protein
LNLSKERIRGLARHWNLAVADKPASPCLASRLAYGQAVTIDRLKRVELAEDWLREKGYLDVRVRLHADDLARIELLPEDLERFFQSGLASSAEQAFRGWGFRFVTIDLGGRQSGSLNRVLPILHVHD